MLMPQTISQAKIFLSPLTIDHGFAKFIFHHATSCHDLEKICPQKPTLAFGSEFEQISDNYANIWIVWFPCSHPASLASPGLILGKIVHFCVRTKTSAVGHLLTPALVLDTIATFKFLTYNCSKHSRIVQIHSTGNMLWSIDILASMVGARWPNSFQPRLIWPRWLGGPWWCPYHHQSIIITSCWLHPCEW